MCQVFATDNGEHGFDLCDLDDGNLIKSFRLKSTETVPDSRLPIQAAFLDGGRALVGVGSDHGAAYVYDRRSTDVIDILYHSTDDNIQVQTVAVRNIFHC